MNYYDVLGIPETATQDEIRDAWRTQIKFYHPDVFPGDPKIAQRKTVQINEAYYTLSDPELRKRYDQMNHIGASSQKETKPKQDNTKSEPWERQPKRSKKGAAVFSVLSAFFVCTLFWWMGYTSEAASKSTGHDSGAKVQNDQKLEKETPPNSGTRLFPLFISEDTETAPFSVITGDEGYYFIKLKDPQTSRDEFILFVHGGHSVTTEVPLGDYYLYYAYGDTWYGTNDLFGPETVYNKSDDLFNFYEEDGYVNGWTVELYLQNNGNMDTIEIGEDEF